MSLKSSLLIAQVTDTHLFADVDRQLIGVPTAESLTAVVEKLQKLLPQPDLLLLTGDLSQDGTPKAYDRLQSLLSPLNLPVYWLPGNHDNLEVMEQSLTHPLFLPDKSFQSGGWQFVLLSSLVPGRVYGELAPSTLTWLDYQLQNAPDRPTIVSLHHPPFQVHSDWLDTSILQNPADLFTVLDRHPQVKLVLFGHIHQEFVHERRGVYYLGTPSTSIQFAPESRDFSLDQEKPGFRLLKLYSDGTWETQVKRVTYFHQLDLAAQGY